VPYILEKKLIPLFPDLITERFGLYLYYLSREHQPKRVRLFIDFLSKRLKGNEQLYLSPATLAKFGNKRGK